MGKWIRDKKSSGCAMCKPWKHGWSLKYEGKELQFRKITDKQIHEMNHSGHHRDKEERSAGE